MIELLRKSYVALLVLFLALVAQIPHAAYVADAAPYLGRLVQPREAPSALSLAYAFAIGFELLTLIFVVHGHRVASYGFAVASCLINLCYYSMHGVDLWSFVAFPAWLLSVLLPVAIASYSHILAGAHDEPLPMPGWAIAGWARLRNPLHRAVQAMQVAHPAPTEDAMDDAQPSKPDRAKQLRSEGFSNAQIAAQLGVNPSTVGRWLNGKEKVQG